MHNNLIQEYVPLNDKNWFKTGGPARFYTQPSNEIEFQQAITFALTHNLPIFMLGEGANILISDAGFDGLVIKPNLTAITQTKVNESDILVTAGAGVKIPDLITWCLANEISGLEEFSGIPGTIGGAVYINLHYYDFLLADFLVAATVIEKATGTLLTVDTAWFNFGYNQSTLLEKNHYLVNATFKLKKLTATQTAYAKGRSVEIIRHRNKRYPTSKTCGSFFRNFYPSEIPFEQNGKKIIWVAYYLDKIGARGELSSGDAVVSHLHANMLVNQGQATSDDIIQLARAMQTKVYERFGIVPQPECQLIGFPKYPLL
jgi:UDP-N-acetylmuramate dehydrogenase